MKVVYDAANIIDAHLIRHALEAAEIPVFLKGEALLGGMGELPLFGVVQVCVPDSAWPQAREVVHHRSDSYMGVYVSGRHSHCLSTAWWRIVIIQAA